jgi:hypothetical protein
MSLNCWHAVPDSPWPWPSPRRTRRSESELVPTAHGPAPRRNARQAQHAEPAAGNADLAHHRSIDRGLRPKPPGRRSQDSRIARRSPRPWRLAHDLSLGCGLAEAWRRATRATRQTTDPSPSQRLVSSCSSSSFVAVDASWDAVACDADHLLQSGLHRSRKPVRRSTASTAITLSIAMMVRN